MKQMDKRQAYRQTKRKRKADTKKKDHNKKTKRQ